MDDIDLDSMPRLQVYFDPNKWVGDNPMQHPSVYQLNED